MNTVFLASNPPSDERKVLIWYKGYNLFERNEYSWRIGSYYHIPGCWRPEGGNGNFNDDVKFWTELPVNPEPFCPVCGHTDSLPEPAKGTCSNCYNHMVFRMEQ